MTALQAVSREFDSHIFQVLEDMSKLVDELVLGASAFSVRVQVSLSLVEKKYFKTTSFGEWSSCSRKEA